MLFKNHDPPKTKLTMTRLILAVLASASAILATSCCSWTSDAKAPPLRPLPQFREIPTAPVEVEYTK